MAGGWTNLSGPRGRFASLLCLAFVILMLLAANLPASPIYAPGLMSYKHGNKNTALGGNSSDSEESASSGGRRLTAPDLAVQSADDEDMGRYDAAHAWHGQMDHASVVQRFRQKLPELEQYNNKAEYLQQPLVADYANHADRAFVMVKTGGKTIWNKTPIHLLTMLTRFPYFQIYSDTPGSIAGHEVVDSLENVTKATYEHEHFKQYRLFKYLHHTHGFYETSQTKADGGWEMDKFKYPHMIWHAYHNAPKSVDWFIIIDDDTYVFADNLMSTLSKLDPSRPLYLGSRAYVGGKPFAHGGSAVVLSRKALELTVGQHPEYVAEYEERCFHECCGDFVMALMLMEKINVEIAVDDDISGIEHTFQGNEIHDIEANPEWWCRRLISLHHLTPHEIETLWEYERLLGPQARHDITYARYYHDFIMPYIDHRLENWDNMVEDQQYTREEAEQKGGKHMAPGAPWRSADNCEQHCKDDGRCLSWRYLPNKQHCANAGWVRIGRPVHELFEGADEANNAGAVSGWLVDRIQKMRRTKSCDPLYGNVHAEGAPDSSESDLTEGWWLRRSPLARKLDKIRDGI